MRRFPVLRGNQGRRDPKEIPAFPDSQARRDLQGPKEILQILPVWRNWNGVSENWKCDWLGPLSRNTCLSIVVGGLSIANSSRGDAPHCCCASVKTDYLPSTDDCPQAARKSSSLKTSIPSCFALSNLLPGLLPATT